MILKEENVGNYEEQVLSKLSNFLACYTKNILKEAQKLSQHQNRDKILIEDVRYVLHEKNQKKNNLLFSKE